jgi:hypothetical protein
MVSSSDTASTKNSQANCQSSELAATYAALILADDGVEITVSLFHQYISTFLKIVYLNGALRLSLPVPSRQLPTYQSCEQH